MQLFLIHMGLLDNLSYKLLDEQWLAMVAVTHARRD